QPRARAAPHRDVRPRDRQENQSMTTTCDQVTAELSELVDGDRDAIARHAEHLAGCDACRDARHDATQLAARVGGAGIDHIPPADLATRVLALLDGDRARTADMSAPELR